jgi:hypothetical protein
METIQFDGDQMIWRRFSESKQEKVAMDYDNPFLCPPLNGLQENFILNSIYKTVHEIQKEVPNAFLDHEAAIMKMMHRAIFDISNPRRRRRECARRECARREYSRKLTAAVPRETKLLLDDLKARAAKNAAAQPAVPPETKRFMDDLNARAAKMRREQAAK